MIPHIRQDYNKALTKEKYEDFLNALNLTHPGAIEFRVAETPVFVPKDFTQKILDACESIVDIITDPGYKELTRNKNYDFPDQISRFREKRSSLLGYHSHIQIH